MITARTTIITGTLLAVFATLAWALNFVAPYVTGAYSIYDLTIIRFLIAGALGSLGVILCRTQRRSLQRSQQLLAAALGAMGYLGYSSCIAAGVIFGGPVLTAACVGFVPVLLALLGNAKEKTVQWHRLALPLTFMVVGLFLANIGSMNLAQAGRASWLTGLFFSVLAVTLWLAFSLLNQSAMGKIPHAATGIWTSLMMAGAGMGTVFLIPVVHMLGLFKLPSMGFNITSAGHLYAWALVIAVMSSVIGAWAWNAATKRLPMVLSGQLISLESLFAAVLGLLFIGRLPTPIEATGLIAVVIGAAIAVHSILGANETITSSVVTRANQPRP
ncbi:DMT family transporter [Pseudomonas sp. MH9.3]|uniref:DMT family transporter n=1 Tax=Pseudomonas sp. MH9.3 TaxID=3048630 RepID=UPI002AC96EAC|nr:EamA family transporter [Pseudomonas sp. MH9.3]MEB0107063.1 EamA family transporter [Pseudomonas sp. MH9.3]WPX80321.1 EamA family transporter [Pseudomonas sp. MH9.3]